MPSPATDSRTPTSKRAHPGTTSTPPPQGIDVAPDVNFATITGRLKGYSGDDITNICRWGADRPCPPRNAHAALPNRGVGFRRCWGACRARRLQPCSALPPAH